MGNTVENASSQIHVANASDQKILIEITYRTAKAEFEIRPIALDLVTTIRTKTDDVYSLTVSPGDCVRVHEELRTLNRMFLLGGDVFCTITTEDGQRVCVNYRVPLDRSIIVTKERTITLARYGSLWVDTLGRNHKK